MTSKRSSKPSKPEAADRTVDMFTGKTNVELAAAATEDVQDAPKERQELTPQEQVDNDRAQVLQITEWTSKHFPISEHGGTEWRMTRKQIQPWQVVYYLEKVFSTDGKSIAAYSGVVVPEEDIFGLADVVVSAARELKQRKAGGK